ncbi:DHA2 family efflux MFS transporter permease subunit [Fodinicola acaciae]|uniref:DHA2 family efflux MFS transporter permease subunit n=1 Tax=Fodinicola acaciae TaxID=2681555 RepID=UPI001FED152D|nr:DHA2 family efflux MFS transporter permease subunit [Fodinicola acaciae]
MVVFGAFAAHLDGSLVNIGLDVIGRDLRAGLGAVQWVASGYLLALAVSLPLTNWLSRRVGAGRLWLVALAAFTVASVLCAAAPTVELLIGLRVVQGLAGGLLLPAGQTILGRAVGPARLGRVMATTGIVVSLAPALGPVIGGLMLHSLSWRWLFAINLPIGLIGLVLGLRYVPRGEPEPPRRLDWPGLLLISAGLPLIVYGLTEVDGGWPLLLAGAVLLVSFVILALRRKHPLLDLRLYRNRVYAAASLASAATGLLMFGTALLFPLYFQIAYHDGVLETGLRLFTLGGGTAACLPLVGRLIDRYGGGAVSLFGCGCVLVVSLPFAFLGTALNPLAVLVLLVLLGGSLAFAAVPTSTAAYKTVRSDQLPDATTQVNIVMRIGGALGAALFAVTLARGLAGGADAAFRGAFTVMAVAAAVAVASAFWVWSELRRPQQVEV